MLPASRSPAKAAAKIVAASKVLSQFTALIWPPERRLMHVGHEPAAGLAKCRQNEKGKRADIRVCLQAIDLIRGFW